MDFNASYDEKLDDELQRECRAMEHSEPSDILERADYRHALAALREPELPNAGEKRRRGNGDVDDEQVIFENDRGGVVRVKGTTANAQIRFLQRHFGDDIPSDDDGVIYSSRLNTNFPKTHSTGKVFNCSTNPLFSDPANIPSCTMDIHTRRRKEVRLHAHQNI